MAALIAQRMRPSAEEWCIMFPDQPHLQAEERELVLAEAHELVGSGATCFMCALRDMLDRRAVAQWLDRRRPSGTSALGVACCPLHGWRLWELACAGESRADETSYRWHELAAQMVRSAVIHVAGAVEEVEARTRHGGWLPGWHERRPPGVLWERLSCGLCPLLPEDAAELTQLVERAYATQDADGRAELVRSLCPRDRLLSYPALRRWPELALPAHRTVTTWSGWWEMPERGASESSFVWRLIMPPVGTSIPDALCPACSIRAEHERLLLRDLRRGGQGARPDGASPDSQLNVADVALAALGDDICARHLALARQSQSDSRGEPLVEVAWRGEGAEVPAPRRWPVGTLRREPATQRCVLCAALHGWDLARMEGLRRAAGSAALSEEMTAALRSALARRAHGLCLGHWILATASAPQVVTQTLLEVEKRSIHALRAAMEHHVAALNGHGPRGVSHDDACAAGIAALAGYPT